MNCRLLTLFSFSHTKLKLPPRAMTTHGRLTQAGEFGIPL
jgi:hypothetical protein